ncbi:MAG: iron-sulfur cluster assembly accessory protein [Myxococcales bacterium]|nr:iron-sulfur cluster assembly accessory protein [Myxococcales bacterium]
MSTVSLLKRQTFVLTEPAALKVKELLAKNGKPEFGLRLRVVGGGCSGLSYKMEMEEAPNEERDKVFEQHGVRVFIDRKSLTHLAGMTLDYKDSFEESGFVYINPNATGTCGCGTSFSA